MIRSPRVLIAARALAGLSQEELAQASGVPTVVLKKLEQGRTDPRNSTVMALIDALSARGIRFISRNDRVAWGVYVERGSQAEAETVSKLQSGDETAEKNAKS